MRACAEEPPKCVRAVRAVRAVCAVRAMRAVRACMYRKILGLAGLITVALSLAPLVRCHLFKALQPCIAQRSMVCLRAEQCSQNMVWCGAAWRRAVWRG